MAASQDTPNERRLSVAARGVIRHGGRLLVTNGDGYWYAPGGRMEPGETLPACLAREVYEETGLTVVVGDDVELAGMDVRPAFLTTLLTERPGQAERSMPVYVSRGHPA